MTGTSGKEDINAGKFYTPACQGHHGHFGGGKPPPSTFPPLQHAGVLECSEREAPCHCPVCQEGGKKANAAGVGGTVGDLGEILSGLQVTIGDRDVLKVSGKGVDSRG